MRSFSNNRTIICGTSIDTSGDTAPSTRAEVVSAGTLRLGDHGHYGYPNFPDKGNVGGPFDVTIYREERIPSQSFETRQYHPKDRHFGEYGYIGFLTVDAPPGVRNTLHNINPEAHMAEAYSKMKPTKPEFQALNSVFELKDVPMMLKSRFNQHNLKEMNNFYLALQFGWLPLLRDVRNLVSLQREAQKRLRQLLRDNGRPIRRNIVLLDDTTRQKFTPYTGEYGLLNRGFKTMLWRSDGLSGQTSEFIQTRTWASARYRYWLPPGPRDIAWKRKMMHRLYGLRVTPSVVYNMIPWSWLVDWFTNAGDMISNLDVGVADRLAADYFYIMSSHEISRERYGWGALNGDLGPYNKVVFSTVTKASEIRKTRFRGNPFGLPANTALSSLTPHQLSILGALGLSRLI